MFIEFDNHSDRLQKRLAKKVTKLLGKYQVPARVETELSKKNDFWKIRQSASTLLSHSENNARALPFIEDGIVPIDKFRDYFEGINELLEKYHVTSGIWGHGGNAHLHIQPILDLGQVGDRQKLFRMMDEYYQMIDRLGGSISGEHGDGRLRAPYLKSNFGEIWYDLFIKVKNIFDPYGIMNPGVKIGVTMEDIKPLIRNSYSLGHLYDHLARS